MKFKSALLLGTIVASTAVLSTPVLAQGIEIVTVTAAKRAENVQNVPISMNVLSQKQLEKYNLSDLKDIAAQVPGMTVVKGQTLNSLYLRGFGTAAGANPALDQTVSLYVDGVYSGRAREYMAPFYDVTRLEVLRGPQGSLLGKNTAAGAISISTNSPTDEFEAGATVGYLVDRAKGVDAYGYVSGPITDTLKARLAMKIIDKNGWMTNANTGGARREDPQYSSQSGRLTLVFDPSADFHMVTKYQFDHVEQDGRQTTGFPFVAGPAGPGLRSQVTSFNQDNPGIIGEVGDLDRNNAHHFSNLIEIDLGDLTFVSQSGFTAFKSRSVAMGRHLPVENVTTDYFDTFEQGTQEFRVLSPSEQTFSWIFGIYGDYSQYNVGNIFRYKGFPTAAFDGAIQFSQKTTAYTFSTYATGTWNITDDFRLIGAARGTWIQRDGDYNRWTVFGVPAGGFPGSGPLALPNQSHTELSFDPSITAQYDITDDINVYASFAKGSKGGAYVATRSTVLPGFYLKPETSTSYDIGLKSTLWDFLTLNVSAFIMQFKNLQVSQYVVLIPGNPPTLTAANAATAESKGVELVMKADMDQWIEGLSFDFTGSFTDARYTDYPAAPCTASSALPANGGCGANAIFTVGPLTGTVFNGKGLPVAGLPDWQSTLGIHYARDLNDWLKLETDVSFDSQSHSWNDGGQFDPLYGRQSSYTKTNFRVGFGAPDDSWNVAVIGYNIFDVLTTSGKYNFGAVNVFTIDEGRRVTIQGSLKLN